MGNRIVIIEDNKDIREAFTLLLNLRDDFLVVNAYSNCEDALKNIEEDAPHIVLMDIDLPGMSGIEGTKIIKKNLPSANIIIITVFENGKTVFDALCAGATGYLTKNSDKDRLMSAIDEVIKGGAPMSSKIARLVVQSFQKNRNSPLTSRETEILSQIAEGKSYTNIADTIFISKETVKYHIKNIYIKLQVNNKADAIKRANEDRLI
ncbi:MAG: response regulator transcription factor [Bacteroidetes bacterium]|nr:response regulator transcription factor [Bacteroidota bacterium]